MILFFSQLNIINFTCMKFMNVHLRVNCIKCKCRRKFSSYAVWAFSKSQLSIMSSTTGGSHLRHLQLHTKVKTNLFQLAVWIFSTSIGTLNKDHIHHMRIQVALKTNTNSSTQIRQPPRENHKINPTCSIGGVNCTSLRQEQESHFAIVLLLPKTRYHSLLYLSSNQM